MSVRATEREESRKRGRVAEIEGHYRPSAIAEIKEGSCKLWDAYADEFRDALCLGAHPDGHSVQVRYATGGMIQSISDIWLLRFPLPKPQAAQWSFRRQTPQQAD